jgi:hypothetical protein
MKDTAKSLVFTWFSASLRNGQSNLAHYTNGLKGMGEYLRTKTCQEFYKVLAGIALNLKTAKNRRVI